MLIFFFSSEKIEMFIDENKALIKRMFGDYTTTPDDGDIPQDQFETYDGRKLHVRSERATGSRATYSSATSTVSSNK